MVRVKLDSPLSRGGSPLDTHPLACVAFLSPPLCPSVKNLLSFHFEIWLRAGALNARVRRVRSPVYPEGRFCGARSVAHLVHVVHLGTSGKRPP